MRSVWKGSLKISLVMVPCRLYVAEEKTDKVSFHRLHRDCLGRMHSTSWCPTCAKEVPHGGTVRGFEYAKGQHVVVSDEELDALETAASSVLEVTTVTDEAINPVFIDGTLYLVPEPGAQQAFETVRQALGDRRAMAHVVLRNRATRVALEAQPEGFLVYQLRAAEQVRTFDEVRPIQLTVVPSRADLSLARQLLDSLEGTFSYENVTDEYTARLKDLLQAKVDGRAPAMPAAAAAPNVASLAEALAQSLKLQQAKQKLPMTAKTVKATLPGAQSRKRA
ncbi:MAG: hypothetical protein IMZ55_11300 [Acidobacteria bacterium]|nr:hypothetical protein [Acidobacteriota bacterium]